jgi:hypothetical protein
MVLDKAVIESKRAVLSRVQAELKTEFFGLDTIIDKVIDSMSAWYIFPQLITRPVIINLWGMTGVGKTQLVRRIVSLLDLNNKFVEVQMDGGSAGGYWSNTISSILSQSTIEEGTPGILLLDEIQRFRTVDDQGGDVKVERYQDVWTLLSDGKFSSDSSTFNEIEMMMIQNDFDSGKFTPIDQRNVDDDDEDGEKKDKPRKRVIHPYEAKNLKKLLRLTESIPTIMTWDTSDIMHAFDEARSTRTSWEIDYSKLVIFVSGNLDTAFTGSTSTDDSDTDADFYHEITKNISSNVIKENLLKRFRPEQISRLGNNHIIYPSMRKLSYQRLIEATCKKYTDEMTAVSNVTFALDQSVLDQIYDNSVFPTQGTRPVFSSIHKIFSNLLVNVTFWAVQHDISAVKLTISNDLKAINVTADGHTASFPVELEMNERKKKTSENFKTLVAVHEAGHSVVYALLNKCAPFEVKINLTSYDGGYMLPQIDNDAITKTDLLDRICILLSGRAVEEIVFGRDHITTGAQSDIASATEVASMYVRRYGFDTIIGTIESGAAVSLNWITEITQTNEPIKQLLSTQYARAKNLIHDNMAYFKHMTSVLIADNVITQDNFVIESAPFITLTTTKSSFSFVDSWMKFNNGMQRIAA